MKPGDDLLGLRLSSMGEQLTKNPWVASVRVRRNFPHSLAIDVVERQPVGVVSMGYLYYLDSNGDIFKPLQEGDSLDFPAITGLAEDDLVHDPAGTKETLKGVLSLLEELKKERSGIVAGGHFRTALRQRFWLYAFYNEQGLAHKTRDGRL